MGNATKGNENQDKIIELLGMLSQLDKAGPTEGDSTIFDFLIDHIQENYIEGYDEYISGKNFLDPGGEEYKFAKEEFSRFITTLTDMKERAYPNA